MAKKKNTKKKVTKKIEKDIEITEEEKDLDIEELEELEELEQKEKKLDKKKPKKKKTKYEKRKIIMKIAGWIMALAMLLGSLISIFGMLIDFQ